MADSLRASEAGLKLVDQARRQHRWNKTSSVWYQQAFTSRSTLNRFWAGQLIRAEAFIALCEIVGVPWQQVAEDDSPAPLPLLTTPVNQGHRIDWGDAPDSQIFYGRESELDTLQHWIVRDRCRLVLIRGMGGMGKTMLTSKLVNRLLAEETEQWDWMIWRSLRNAPPLPQLLDEILATLDPTQESQTHSLPEKQLQLLDFCRHQRGLLVLDNVETLLSSQHSRDSDDQGNHYEAGYENYGDLFRLIGDSAHQSCLILTSREIPKNVVNQGGEQLPIRCFPLEGLQPQAIRALFQDRGQFTGSEQHWDELLRHYAGNPLALKIIATSVCDFFGGNLSNFLEYVSNETLLFGDIKDLLDRQFTRLSSSEYTLMFWLAINREPISLPDLQTDICHLTRGEVLQGLSSLQHRSLIEKRGNAFTQQPVVMEYVLEQLIEKMAQDILNPEGSMATLRHYALAKVQSKDYIYQVQVKLILEPTFERVSQTLDHDAWLERTRHILQSLQQKPQQAAYGAGNLINLLRCGLIDLQRLDFSGLPIWQANLEGLMLTDVSFMGADMTGAVFTEMIGNVLSADFSGDGTILGTSDNGYCIRLWDVETGRLLSICKGHQHWIRSVAFAPASYIKSGNCALLASGSADCTIRLWDIKTGEALKILQGHTDEVFSVAFCPENMILASASGDRTLRLWDLMTGDCLFILHNHEQGQPQSDQYRVRVVIFSPKKSGLLASGDDQGTLKIWNLRTQDCCHRIDAHQGWVRAIAFTADGTSVLSGGNDGMIRLWNIQTGDLIREWVGHPGGVYALSYLHAEKIFATGGADHKIRLWDIDTGDCLTTIYGHDNQIYSVAFSPDAQTLAGVSLDQTVKLWNWRQNLCLKTWRGYTDWGFPIAISEDGQHLVSGSGANTIHIWDMNTHTWMQSLPGYPALVRAVVILSTRQLAVAGAAPVIQLWDWQKQLLLRELIGHQDWVLNLAMPQNQSSQYLASCSADQTIRIWNIDDHGKETQVLRGHQDHVNTVAFSPIAETPYLLASGSSDSHVKLWNWQTGECLRTFSDHTHRIYGLAFHPTQTILASGSADLTIRLWDIESGKCLQTFKGHTGWIFAIAMSPCGQYLISGGQDQQVKLWELKSGSCIRTFEGHRHQVYSVAFAPQGQWIVSGSQDQTIRIWDIESGDCLHHLSARLYERMNITGAKGLSSAQRLTLEELGAIS